MTFNRDYNFFRRYKRLCVQIILPDFEKKHLAVQLTPSVSIGHNYQCCFAVGFQWLFGSVNLGVLTKSYSKDIAESWGRELARPENFGLTMKQIRLKWKGY